MVLEASTVLAEFEAPKRHCARTDQIRRMQQSNETYLSFFANFFEELSTLELMKNKDISYSLLATKKKVLSDRVYQIIYNRAAKRLKDTSCLLYSLGLTSATSDYVRSEAWRNTN